MGRLIEVLRRLKEWLVSRTGSGRLTSRLVGKLVLLNHPLVTVDGRCKWPMGYPALLVDIHPEQFRISVFHRPKDSATTGWYRPGAEIWVILLVDGRLLTAEIRDGDLVPLA